MPSSSLVPIVEMFNLKKDYETPTGSLPILKGIQCEIRRGDMIYIVGRSGSGKTTLLNLLGGLDHPTAGKIEFEGQDMTSMDEQELAYLRNMKIGYVFQFYHLLPELTLFENVMLPTLIAGERDEKWTRELLKRVKLWGRRDHYPSELSGGEKQRTAIARALINRPSVVICDEPTGNLDEETAESIQDLLHHLNQDDGQTFVIVTHDENWAWRYHRVLRLYDGVLVPENRGGIEPARTDAII